MCKRILVVDDDLQIRSLLQALLESEGYYVDTASDGQSAWEKLNHHPGIYEAVLLDVCMPRMDGLQLIQMLWQQKAVWTRSLIVLSANSEALQQATRMGVCHVLEKPFDLDAVLALVSTCLT
jgi:two-component system alkaline phosphatase synthesis response regulator PhoP